MCRRTFTSQENKTYHVRKVHKKITYLCEHCGKQFTDKKNRDQHVRTQHEGIFLYCEHCGDSFNSRQSLSYHKAKSHDEGTKYYCDQCPEFFARASDLRYHNCKAAEQWKKIVGVKRKQKQSKDVVKIESTIHTYLCVSISLDTYNNQSVNALIIMYIAYLSV